MILTNFVENLTTNAYKKNYAYAFSIFKSSDEEAS